MTSLSSCCFTAEAKVLRTRPETEFMLSIVGAKRSPPPLQKWARSDVSWLSFLNLSSSQGAIKIFWFHFLLVSSVYDLDIEEEPGLPSAQPPELKDVLYSVQCIVQSWGKSAGTCVQCKEKLNCWFTCTTHIAAIVLSHLCSLPDRQTATPCHSPRRLTPLHKVPLRVKRVL